jgi:excisionase family DNA binding protein
MTEEKSLYAATELAKILGVSRQEVIRRIWRGFIKAQKVGNQYIITKKEAQRVIASERQR